VKGNQKTSKAPEAAIPNTPATPAPKNIVGGNKAPAKAKDVEPSAKENQSGKRPREDSDTEASVVDLSDVDVNGAAATSTSIPVTNGVRTKRSKKDSGGENKVECSWKCQTISMQLGLKCQAALTSTSTSASACRGSRFACQTCSDHATGDSAGPIVCYECADSAQTKRWYAAKEKGKKHFCLV
jgi:hypothetical protein